MKIDTEKTMWYHKGKDFTVEICVWSYPSEREALKSWPSNFIESVPEYHWNVYVHIFPKHRLFNKVEKEELFDYGIDIPLHMGTTYNNWKYSEKGEIISKTIGCDYQHYDDDRFGKYSTKQDAWEVFGDAEELIEFFAREESPSIRWAQRKE